MCIGETGANPVRARRRKAYLFYLSYQFATAEKKPLGNT